MLATDILFSGRKFDTDKLLEFGFEENSDSFVYSKFLNDDIKMIFAIAKSNGNIETNVIDTTMNEDFDLLFISSATGDYVNALRNEYDKVIVTILDVCFPKTVTCLPKKPKLPGYFESQIEAALALYKCLVEKEEKNGSLSELEVIKQEELYSFLEGAKVASVDVLTDEIGYGTEFEATINGRKPRHFTMVYASAPVMKSLTGSTFIQKDDIFGSAVFGKKTGELFTFVNANGLELEAMVTDINCQKVKQR